MAAFPKKDCEQPHTPTVGIDRIQSASAVRLCLPRTFLPYFTRPTLHGEKKKGLEEGLTLYLVEGLCNGRAGRCKKPTIHSRIAGVQDEQVCWQHGWPHLFTGHTLPS
jgi:hypothetical protein